MSYHILHQFDEQWFADNVQNQEAPPKRRFGIVDLQQPSQPTSAPRQWLIVMASLLVAACALYFALDARHHANDLQHRLAELETQLKK